jgi:hypothetical protein
MAQVVVKDLLSGLDSETQALLLTCFTLMKVLA